MEKASMEMDFEEWELLPDNRHTFLDIGIESFVDMNYFICPDQPPNLLEEAGIKKIPIPENERKDEAIVAEKQEDGVDPEFKDIGVVSPPLVIIADRDLISKVFFKKLKEDELADMMADSPKSTTNEFSMPAIGPGAMILFDKEEEEEFYKGEDMKNLTFEKEEKDEVGDEIEGKQTCFSIWRWRITGIGALCSIGVATASTICILVLGGRQRQRQHHQHQKLQFQIYTDNKRIKQVVQQASRLNQALSPVRGVPMTRAHISFGGYYDGL